MVYKFRTAAIRTICIWPERSASSALCSTNVVRSATRFKRVKFTLEEDTKAQKGSRCIALLFLQLRANGGVGGQGHVPAVLPPGKSRYALYRRMGGPQGRSGWLQKISPPAGFDPRVVQPEANRYTDSAIPAHDHTGYIYQTSRHHILNSPRNYVYVFVNLISGKRSATRRSEIYIKKKPCVRRTVE